MLPSHNEASEFVELVNWYTFAKHISWLIVCVDWMNADLASIDMVTKMMHLHVHVFGSGTSFVHCRNLQSTTVVFKNRAMYSWLC